MDCSYEKHPFPTFYNNKIKYLIIGSFPPIKLTKKVFCDDNLKQLYEKYLRKNPFIKGNDINFYYGSRENHFWPLFRRLYNKSLSNSEEIKKFLESKNIGITDLFEQCKRKIKNCNIYPSDANLIILMERSLENLFNECSKLGKIYFTSKWIYNQFIKLYPSKENDYEFIILESPSGSCNRSIGKIKEYKQKKSLNSDFNTFTYRLEKYKEKLPTF